MKSIFDESKFPFSEFRYEPETGAIFKRDKSKRRDFLHRTNRYRFVERNYIRVPAHRLAWKLHYGQWPDKEIDHINRDRQDNRISNLRQANRSQNVSNAPALTTCKSGERGVYWSKRFRTWCWCLKLDGKKYCGYARHKISAILAARLIRRVLHGEFAA